MNPPASADADPLPAGKAAAIITAAGTSSRFGGGEKKEYVPLPSGEPVIVRVLRTFINTKRFDILVLTVPPGHEKRAAAIVSCLPENPPILIAAGGKTRQDSVRIALTSLENAGVETVLIHDGARPWVSAGLILTVLDRIGRGASNDPVGAAPAVASVDALKRVDAAGRIVAHEDRDRILRIQTPQGFPYGPILDAHRKALRDGFASVDDTEVFTRYGGIVYTVPGETANRKITYPKDIEETIDE